MSRLRALAALCSTVAVISCGPGEIPSELTELPPRPAIPPRGATDNAWMDYAFGMEAWSETAIRRMRAIRNIVRN